MATKTEKNREKVAKTSKKSPENREMATKTKKKKKQVVKKE